MQTIWSYLLLSLMVDSSHLLGDSTRGMLTNLGNNEDSAFVYLEQSRKNQGNVIHDSFDSQEEEKKH
jgi:hypothetical protein